MKKLLILSLIIMAITGCKDDKEAERATLTLNPDQDVVILADGAAQTLTVTTNQQVWKATVPQDAAWCVLNENGSELSISASVNTETTPLNTVVTITAGTGNNAAVKTLNVTQNAADAATLTLNPDQDVVILADGAAQTLTVITNQQVWKATVPQDAAWCVLNENGSELSISAPVNTETTPLNTVVTITAGTGNNTAVKTLNVTQVGVVVSVYKIDIPSDFSTGYVQKVMAGGKKIAEICKEYIKITDPVINEQMVVVYPVVDGNVDLTKGMAVKDGGSIVWNSSTNTCTYTVGSSAPALTSVYLDGGELSVTEPVSSGLTTISPDILTDSRVGQTEAYKIVKIGTQYWMAENLRAEKYRDGTAILTNLDNTAWNDNTTGAFRYLNDAPGSSSDPTSVKMLYGALYNGYAMFNTAGLAPAGWIVPSNVEWVKLRTYIKTPYGQKLADKEPYWISGNLAATNITGFTARPAGAFTTATGYSMDGTDAWFWSSTISKHWLDGETPVYYRINNASTGMVTDNHTYNFGHSIRCVRE